MSYTADNYLYVEIQIGDWNMDSTASIDVAHNLSATEFKTIRNIEVIVRDDADAVYCKLYTQTVAANMTRWDSTNIKLDRDASGEFDSDQFNATDYNRGWVIFKYIPD